MFIAWLNLDIGFDVCYVKDLNAFYKILLQLIFPVYIISLIVCIYIISKQSSRFANQIGKKDPIATLATLILLSYTKLLSITIAALSPTVLSIPYPNGKTDLRWRIDGTMRFLQDEHIVLAIIAVLINLVIVPFTLLIRIWLAVAHWSFKSEYFIMDE